ncbi:hypothetical protein Nepgr_001623 [Nepenthes gracilis]|uniref:Uncharacterized protein n=1 Tax=Nepenthes gracilis TaxID=150966 RepID=A0AAD3P8J2_NEPGR|nr:hypothetical protein Nepgr_001623 [Nepenthes gracilis]
MPEFFSVVFLSSMPRFLFSSMAEPFSHSSLSPVLLKEEQSRLVILAHAAGLYGDCCLLPGKKLESRLLVSGAALELCWPIAIALMHLSLLFMAVMGFLRGVVEWLSGLALGVAMEIDRIVLAMILSSGYVTGYLEAGSIFQESLLSIALLGTGVCHFLSGHPHPQLGIVIIGMNSSHKMC